MTETEKAFVALAAALNASSALPAVRRDVVFEDVLDDLSSGGDSFGAALTLAHGEAVETVRRIGEGPNAFELTRVADVEWIAAGDPADALQTFFDAGVEAVFAAIEADPTLGANVVRAEIVEQPEISREAAGGRAALIARIRVQMLFTSPRAY